MYTVEQSLSVRPGLSRWSYVQSFDSYNAAKRWIDQNGRDGIFSIRHSDDRAAWAEAQAWRTIKEQK